MYRKKEIILLIVTGIIIIVWNFLSYFPIQQKEELKTQPSPSKIQLKIEGEVVRPAELIYLKPVSYGVLFLRLEHSFNIYSDLSGFDLDEIIYESKTIVIPTLDIGNVEASKDKIYIQTASLTELMQLPQIGEKRASKILEYIETYGKIKTWDIFFQITSVPENAKEQIKQQAIL